MASRYSSEGFYLPWSHLFIGISLRALARNEREHRYIVIDGLQQYRASHVGMMGL